MENYKLYIEDLGGTWRIADLGKEKPAMNYQVNNLAELKDRQVDYSQALKLPFTPTNCEIFGYSNEFDVITDIPYRKLNCRLLCNDTPIAGKGSYLMLDKITDSFETKIVSGNVDLFESMKRRNMADLDLGTYTVGSLSMDNVLNSNVYCVPLATFRRGGASSFDMSSEHSYPFVYLKHIVDKIFQDSEYSFVNNLSGLWENKALSIVSMRPDADSLLMFNASATANIYGTFDSPQYSQFSITNSGMGGLVAHSTPNRAEYTAKTDCTFKIQLEVTGLNVHPLNTITILIKNATNDDVILNKDFKPAIVGEIFSFNQEVEMKKNDVILISMYREVVNVGSFESTLHFTDMACKVIPVGGKLHFSTNLGLTTQFDFLKMLMQLFGLTVYVDNGSKVVYAYTMQKVYDNKLFAKDWSAKLHNSKDKQTSFALNGYAIKNTISFEINEHDEVEDIGSFEVNNYSLEESKNLFTLKYEAGLDKNIGNVITANIPFEIEDEEIVVSGGTGGSLNTVKTYKFDGAKPHIVDIYLGRPTITLNGLIVTWFYDVKIAKHAKAQSFINTYYSGLTTMLNDAKIIEDEFLLTDEDIEEYKAVKDGVPGCFIPVYIQKYGAYFYINKIKNFVSGRPTKCELVKL